MSRDQVPDLRDMGALLSVEHRAGVAGSGGRARLLGLLIAAPHLEHPARSYLRQREGNAGTLVLHGQTSPAQVPTTAEATVSGVPGLLT